MSSSNLLLLSIQKRGGNQKQNSSIGHALCIHKKEKTTHRNCRIRKIIYNELDTGLIGP